MSRISIAVGIAAIALVACTDSSETSDATGHTDDDTADTSPYVGGWPVNPDKDALGAGTSDVPLYEGTQLPRLTLLDQYGDEVDLYDFSGQPGVLVLESVAKDYENCQEMSKLLAGQQSKLAEDVPSRTQIADIIEGGEVRWLRAIGSERDSDVEVWHEWYPAPASPVLLDRNGVLARMFVRYWGDTRTGGYPAIALIDPATMKVIAEPDDSLRNLDEVVATYGE